MEKLNVEIERTCDVNADGADMEITLPSDMKLENVQAKLTGTGKKPMLENLEVETVNMNDFTSMIPEDETAVETLPELKSIDKLDELGFFSPVRGMGKIKNVFGNRLYAKNYIDAKHNRYVIYRQRYDDGSYSPEGRVEQAGLKLAAEYKFNSQAAKEPKIRNKVGNFILNVATEYNAKIAGGKDESIETYLLLDVLYNAMPHLPVDSDVPTEIDARTFYTQITEYLDRRPPIFAFDCKSYYILENDYIEAMAKEMEMPRLELLKTLKKFGFLYLTASSRGYQTNIRIKESDGKSFNHWAYCIFKLENLAGIKKIKKEENIIF